MKPSFGSPTYPPSKAPSTIPSIRTIIESPIDLIQVEPSASPSILPSTKSPSLTFQSDSPFHESYTFNIRLSSSQTHELLRNGPFEVFADCSIDGIGSITSLISCDENVGSTIHVYGYVPTQSSFPLFYDKEVAEGTSTSSLLWNSVDDFSFLSSSSGHYIRIPGSVNGIDRRSFDDDNGHFGKDVDCIFSGEIKLGFTVKSEEKKLYASSVPSNRPSSAPSTIPSSISIDSVVDLPFHESYTFNTRLSSSQTHELLRNGPFEVFADCSIDGIGSITSLISCDENVGSTIHVYGYVPTQSSFPLFYDKEVAEGTSTSSLLWNSVDDFSFLSSSSGHYIRIPGSVNGIDRRSFDDDNGHFGKDVDCIFSGEIQFGYGISI